MLGEVGEGGPTEKAFRIKLGAVMAVETSRV